MLKTDNYIFKSHQENQTLILLHGYNQTKEDIIKYFEIGFETFNLLAIEGPIKKELGSAWYEYDTLNDKYLSSIDEPLQKILEVIGKLSLHHHKLFVIGHSQGAYLAPLLQDYLQIEKTIGVSCLYQKHRFNKYKNLYFMFDPKDKILTKENFGEIFNKNLEKKLCGHYLKIENAKHDLNQKYISQIKHLLESSEGQEL
jgi:predicted esterase